MKFGDQELISTSGAVTKTLTFNTNTFTSVTSGKGIEIGSLKVTSSNGNYVGFTNLTGNSFTSISSTAIYLCSSESFSIIGTSSHTLLMTTNTVSTIASGHGLYIGTRTIVSTGDITLSNTLS